MRWWSKPIAGVVAVVAFVAASAGVKQLLQRHEPSIPSNLATQPWTEVTLGARIAFDAPWQLHAERFDLPPQVVALVKSSTYLTNEADGVMIGAMEFSYRADVDVRANLDGAADGAIANLHTPPGTLSVDASKSDTTILGSRAIEVDARIHRDRADPLRAHGLVFSDQNELVMLISISGADEDGGALVWDRVRKSIRAR